MKRSSLVRVAALSVIGLAFGCADGSTTPSAATLDGTWAREFGFPGSSELWTVVVQGTRITGTGTWTGEACCSGTLTLTGAIINHTIHVDLTLVTTAGVAGFDRHEQFDGILISSTELVGQGSTDGGPPAAERLKKQ